MEGILKELRDGFSAQAKISNRYWVSLMIASVFYLLHDTNANEKIKLPFDFGEINDPIHFHFFFLLMICALTIAFASAWLQQNRTMRLIQKVIDDTPENEKYIDNIHIRDLLDSTITGTFNRVAPIAQVLQGEHQFFGANKPLRAFKLVGAIVYFLLKIVTSAFIFIIPMVALCKTVQYFLCHSAMTSWGIPPVFYWFLIFISFFVFLIMIVSDFKYVFKTMGKILTSK